MTKASIDEVAKRVTASAVIVRKIADLAWRLAKDEGEFNAFMAEANCIISAELASLALVEAPQTFNDWFQASNPPEAMDAGVFFGEMNAFNAGTHTLTADPPQSGLDKAIEVVKEKRDMWERQTQMHFREDPFRHDQLVRMLAANQILTALESLKEKQ